MNPALGVRTRGNRQPEPPVAFDAALGRNDADADGALAREFFETKPPLAGQVFATPIRAA